MSEVAPGDLIEIWDGGEVVSAVLLGTEKGRLLVVTEAGKRVRIAASRIALRTGARVSSDPAAATGAAAAHAEEARHRASTVDLEALWELLVDEGGRHSVEALTGLAMGEDSPENRAGLIRSLSLERTFFERKGDLWTARSRETVEQTRRRIRAEKEKARRLEAFVGKARLRLEGAGGDEEGFSEEDSAFLDKIVDLAVHGDESVHRRDAVALLNLLDASSGQAPVAAFGLLVRLGLFSPDENLEIRRHGLRTLFPPEALAVADAAVESMDGCSREDLTHLEAWSIDDSGTVEIDDALSWEEREDGTAIVGVHIADPAAFIRPGDAVDGEAQRRACTYYFPDTRIPMLPPVLSEERASLIPGERRPALSLLATVSREGAVLGHRFVPSWVRTRGRLTYDEADALIQGVGEEHAGAAAALRALHRTGDLLERERAESGAIVLRSPEIGLKVDEGGRAVLKRIDERGPSRLLVAEMMILANSAAASLCFDRRIPAIYRKQDPPEGELPPLPEGPYDPIAVRAFRRRLRRGEVSLQPGSHYALGLPAYVQITSPLRRYQDLAVQRQIKASLSGRPLPYEAAEIARIAATTEEAERAARQAEAGSNAYWILKYLEARIGQDLEAVILETEPRRSLVEIGETLSGAILTPRDGHAPGARLLVRIESVRPREGILRLCEPAPDA